MTKKIAAAYIRVSTGAQAEADKASLDDQRSACVESARDQGYRLPKGNVFSEAISGAATVRPEFDEMMDAARDKKFDRLFVWAQDRLSRGGMATVLNILSELDDLGIEVWSFQEGDLTDELLTGIRGWVAGQERKRIAARTAPAKRKKRDAGYWVSGTIPYGYVRGENMTLKQEPVTAETVYNLYKWSIEGHGRIWMARRLNKDHVPPPFLHFKLPDRDKPRRKSSSEYSGDWDQIEKWMIEHDAEWHKGVRPCWSQDNISKLIHKTIYMGELHSVPMRIEPAPIVDISTWSNAISAMQGRNMKGKGVRQPRLLTGMIKCGSCGKAYIHHENGQGHQYYICSGRRSGNGCKFQNIKMHTANFAALEHAHRYLGRQVQRGDFFAYLRGDSSSKLTDLKARLIDKHDGITEAAKEHGRLQEALVKAVDAGLTADDIPKIASDIKIVKTALTKMQREEREILGKIKRRNEIDQDDEDFAGSAAEQAIDLVSDVLGSGDVITFDQCRETLNLLVTRLIVGPDKAITVKFDESADALRDVIRYLGDEARKSAEFKSLYEKELAASIS